MMRDIQKGCFREIKRSRIFRVLDYIQQVEQKEKVIYIRGQTYKKLEDIRNLEDILDVKVVFTQSCKKGLFMFIPFIFPNNFLIKINAIKNIRQVFELLEDHHPITMYIFDEKYEKNFIENFTFKDYEYVHSLFANDSEYFIYGVDFDNSESSTGVLEYIEYGDMLPKNMKWFL